jgi:8-oxo-dGTP pyrophosphatase MutT (NUDIX family)
MMSNGLVEIAHQLPRVAEEGTDHEVVPEAMLVQHISESVDGGVHAARALVTLVRRMLVSAAVLDARELEKGNWRIVSFPALLFARSLLIGLGDDAFRLLETGFWEPSDYLIDRQRGLIRSLEQRRSAASEKLPAIRRVWVAWTMMACDGRFLLVRREDPNPRRDGNRGEYVLPGGRASAMDLGDPTLDQRLSFFDPFAVPADSDTTLPILRRTLARELLEELELGADALASMTSEHDRIRYVDLEGAKAAHAHTEYLIQMFRVSLTEKGKSELLRSLARYPDRYAWFTAEELAAKKNSRGDRAFVDALIATFGEDMAPALDATVSDIPLGAERPFFEKVDFPLAPEVPLTIGRSGSERRIVLDVSQEQLLTLGVLVAIRRGDPISALPTGLMIAPMVGWLVIEDPAMLAEMKLISNTLRKSMSGSPLLSFQGIAARINTSDARLACFNAKAFSLSIADERRGKSYRLRLRRTEIHSSIGSADALEREAHVAETFGSAVHELAEGKVRVASDNLDTVKRVQRGELEGFLNSVGARLLVRQVDGVPELAVGRATIG